MDTNLIISLAVILLMLAGTLWWVLNPLWQGTQSEQTITPEEQALVELEQRRDAIYKSIKDMDLDFATNKLSEEDYQHNRQMLMREAADVLRDVEAARQKVDASLDAQVDALMAESAPVLAPAGTEDSLRDSLRADILAQAKSGGAAAMMPCPDCGTSVKSDDAFCSQCGTSLAGVCPSCQGKTGPADAFCTHCGTRLVEEATE